MADQPTPVLSVLLSKDGVWSVNERGPNRTAVACFIAPHLLGKYATAVRVARAKRRCRVALVERDGAVRLARDYDSDGTGVETP